MSSRNRHGSIALFIIGVLVFRIAYYLVLLAHG